MRCQKKVNLKSSLAEEYTGVAYIATVCFARVDMVFKVMLLGEM